MPSRIITIGDIHGCLTALDTLLDKIAPAEDDLLIPLGDYVDRGPNSKGVIDRMLELETVCDLRPILGNHEQMMQSVLLGETGPSDWLRYGGVATLESYGFEGDLTGVPEAHRDYLDRCIDYYETETHFFLHANYVSDVPLDQLDGEILRWVSLAMSMPGPHQNGKIAIVGHTPDEHGEIMDVGFLKCIDTYCYGGQWLTALDVLSGRVWQANEEGHCVAR